MHNLSLSTANETVLPQRFSLIDNMRNFMPMHDFSDGQLSNVLRDRCVEYYVKGQHLLFEGQCDDDHLYLLSGSLKLSNANCTTILQASDFEAGAPIAAGVPRAFTVETNSDVVVVRISKVRISASVAWSSAARIIEQQLIVDKQQDAAWLHLLLRSNLFYKVPPINIDSVWQAFRKRLVGSSELVVREGDVADACFIIVSGGASVYQRINGREQHVADLGIGDCFGEDGLLGQVPRNATVKMTSDGELRVLEKHSFLSLLSDNEMPGLTLSEARREVMSGASWLDVRSAAEYEQGHCRGSAHLVLEDLLKQCQALGKGHRYICYCDSGHRSRVAAHFLRKAGFDAESLCGGYDRYAFSGQAHLLA